MATAPSPANSQESREKQAETGPATPVEALPRRFERFLLLSRIARGGMGEVYLATIAGIEGAERPLVIKIIRPDHAHDRSFNARFLDEARIQAQLRHPGVAQILEAATDAAGRPYVVVEHVEGRNLSEVRVRAGQLGVRIGWPEACALGVCLGDALCHVHERTDPEGKPLEIVHRDLSPQNVMIGYGGDLKLIDFGTARGQNRRCQTVAGIVFAKPGYVAPEVANNNPGGVPADLYAFGVVLWELLAGRRFLKGEASEHMAAVGAGKRALPPLARELGAPTELDSILARLTATRVEDRYASAREATLELVRVLQRAPSLPDGDRSVRGRIAHLMQRLYPAEPARGRADFAAQVAAGRGSTARPSAPAPSPEPERVVEPDLLPGTRYRIVREIGRGAAGIVYEATHVDLARKVAVKVLSEDALGASAQGRFRAEARAVARLEHPNLVKLYDFGICADGRPFYAMELLAGESLDQRLARSGRLSAREAVGVGVGACAALGAAHAAGLVHRDVKPANLFVTKEGTLKVLDFGVVAARQDAQSSEGERVSLFGTPEYMAPEQARGRADERSDVYALGSVLYELLTGSMPFPEAAPLAVLAQKAKSVPERPSQRARQARLTAALDRVILRALEPEPERRYRSMAELAAALSAALTAPVRRRRLGARPIAAAIVLAGLGLAIAASLQNPLVYARFAETRSIVEARGREIVGRLMAARGEAPPARQADARPIAGPSVDPAPMPIAAAPAVTIDIDADQATKPPAPSASDDVDAEDDEMALADERELHETETGPAPVPGAGAALASAQALLDAGRELRALAELRRAARRYPTSAEILALYARAAESNRAWGEAVRVARRRAEIDKSAAAQFDLARLERATGHRDRAVRLLTALAELPDAPPEAAELLRVMTGAARVARL